MCVKNPPATLTSAGCALQFPPGCDCDPEAENPDMSCPVNNQCIQCKCLPLGCNCNPNADEPNSFCLSGDICKVSKIKQRTLGIRTLEKSYQTPIVFLLRIVNASLLFLLDAIVIPTLYVQRTCVVLVVSVKTAHPLEDRMLDKEERQDV